MLLLKDWQEHRIVVALFVAVQLSFGCTSHRSSDIQPRADYAAVAAELERLITHEVQDKKLPALSIALVDDQETVWAKGFGWENPDTKLPATAETVYRVGSVSKLFTDIGIMQLAERGAIDLDAPVTNYLPDFKPNNPFDKAITLRQLMSHRSGLVREPPVGNYFDDTAPSLAQTVQSLNSRKDTCGVTTDVSLSHPLFSSAWRRQAVCIQPLLILHDL